MKIVRTIVGLGREAVEERMGMETMIEVVATRIAKTTDGGIGRDHDRNRRKLKLVLDHGPARLVAIGIGTSYDNPKTITPLDQVVQHGISSVINRQQGLRLQVKSIPVQCNTTRHDTTRMTEFAIATGSSPSSLVLVLDNYPKEHVVIPGEGRNISYWQYYPT